MWTLSLCALIKLIYSHSIEDALSVAKKRKRFWIRYFERWSMMWAWPHGLKILAKTICWHATKYHKSITISDRMKTYNRFVTFRGILLLMSSITYELYLSPHKNMVYVQFKPLMYYYCLHIEGVHKSWMTKLLWFLHLRNQDFFASRSFPFPLTLFYSCSIPLSDVTFLDMLHY